MGESEHSRAPRDSDGRYHRVVEAAPTGMHLYRLEGEGRLVLVDANAAADRILGLDHRAMLGRSLEEAFPALVGTEIPQRYRSIARGGPAWSTELIEYADETIRGAFEVHAFQTGPDEMAALFLDVAPRRRAEEALRRSEERYRHLVENQQDLIVEADVDGRLRFVSPSYCRLFGKREEELVGQYFMPLVHEEDRGATLQALERLFLPPTWRRSSSAR
jgi:PAS domain-containing protein